MSNSEVVVVTGVSSGIGRVTAEKFAKRGCRVFGTVRNTAKAQSIPGVVLVEMDIRDEASVQHGIQAIIAQAKRIDVLVNSKGQASLLSKLRRFMPAGPVDASLRKTFGLA
jgi:NAD(P)-dependent dehydrogenase (short-subunit alcohol dehydrogenase family)